MKINIQDLWIGDIKLLFKPIFYNINLKFSNEQQQVVFSKNQKVNINKFIESYNKLNFASKINGAVFLSADLASSNSISDEYEFDIDLFSNNPMYLYITGKPDDILSMSISKFYWSCMNLYDGEYRNKLLSNVFDENMKVCYFIFDVPFIDNNDNEHPYTAFSRTIIRKIKNSLYMDRAYPDRLEMIFYNLLNKYYGKIHGRKQGLEYIQTPTELGISYNDTYKHSTEHTSKQILKYLKMGYLNPMDTIKELVMNSIHLRDKNKIINNKQIINHVFKNYNIEENTYTLGNILEWYLGGNTYDAVNWNYPDGKPDYELVKILVDNGADVNDSLETACKKGYEDIVRLFLEDRQVSVSYMEDAPLKTASLSNNENIMNLLIENGAPENYYNLRNIIRSITEQDYQINLQEGKNTIPILLNVVEERKYDKGELHKELGYAILKEQSHIYKMLISFIGKININPQRVQDWSTLAIMDVYNYLKDNNIEYSGNNFNKIVEKIKKNDIVLK